MKKMLPALLMIVLCGCGPGFNFSPYVGQQQNWTTQPGTYVRLVDGIPVYSPGQYPERPYVIVGSVTTDNEHNLVKAVRAEHADAAIVFSNNTYRSGTVAIAGPGVIFNEPLRHSVLTAQLIKYR